MGGKVHISPHVQTILPCKSPNHQRGEAAATFVPVTYHAFGAGTMTNTKPPTFAPAVGMQHSRLVAMRDSYEKLLSDHPSYQLHTGPV